MPYLNTFQDNIIMPNIKASLYLWKRHFGVPIDFYREEATEADILTGKRTTIRTKYSIQQGIFLDQTLRTGGPLTRILNQLTGVMDVSRTSILFDADDFVDHYIPVLSDYVIIHHQRYEINEIKEVDNRQTYWITLQEFKGTGVFEQYDIRIKDKLQLIQTQKMTHNYKYNETTIDTLELTENLNIE